MSSASFCRLLVSNVWILIFVIIRNVDCYSQQRELLNSLEQYAVVVPSRVTREGNHVTYTLHPGHSLRRRSADFDRKPIADDTLHYQVQIDDKNYVLQLYPNFKLTSPGFVVERKKNRFGNITDSSFTRLPPEYRNCHYHGHVINGTETKVAVGVCNGLHGLIHTDDDQYFIEPLKNEEKGPAGQHKHVIYKRSALAPELDPLRTAHVHKRSAEDNSCGVKEFVNADRRRERWQAHHRHARQSSDHHRQKRSFSTERYVETLVVVDPSMVKYHKNEHLETYVLTIMNMVAVMFHDASIGNSINIVLVRVLLIEEDQKDLTITHHADRTLTSFCKYQKKINFKDDDHPNHHDVAVLFTRKNICSRLDEPCSTLGLAQVSGMCQPHWSCNINEDTGLALAYTVTHEIGHNFGMHHDGYRNGCEEPAGKQLYLMSPSLVADSLTKVWSTCSRDAITKFIDRDWGYCLNDEPGDHDHAFPVLPPGTMYDANHQCRLQYGDDNSTICTNEQDVCSNLWCRTEDKRCSTHLEAAAEGTICGKNKTKWCYQGKCVKIGDRPESINGEWGQWTSWSDCTRSCGGGVSHSQRHCDNPRPSHGGKYCLGERKRYRICNTEDCPDDGKTFNQAQCEEFNIISYKGHYYEWEHVLAADSPCQLHCKPKNRFFSSLLKDIVTDGTPCTPGTLNMCISGRCRHIGCDYVIDSKAKEDRCGVCHGDGSTCTTIKDQFKESKGLGYVEATVIPRGARNIWVEEMAEANNFLALQNDRGEYYLNGHWFIQWSGDYEIAGTVIHYKRIGNKESFKAPGPLKEPLHIMLLLQSANPGVSFEYTVPKENISEPRTPKFNWVYLPWTHCTASCGGGTQRAEVVCTEIEAGVVDDKYCGTGKPDDKQKACNDYLCPARWWNGPWQHCSVTCGKDGTHQRTVICVRSMGLDEQIALDDEACDAKEKPPEIEPCHKKEPCPGISSWVLGEWSECGNNPCGVKFRSVKCENPTIGCDKSTIPVSEMPCSNISCGQWVTENWSQCPVTCGMGEQRRTVRCEGEEHCNKDIKPSETKICIFEPCPIVTASPSPSTSTAGSAVSSTVSSSTKKSVTGQNIISTTKSSLNNDLLDSSKISEYISPGRNNDNLVPKNDSVNESTANIVDKEGSIEIENFDDVGEDPMLDKTVVGRNSIVLSGMEGIEKNNEFDKIEEDSDVYEPEIDKVFDKESEGISNKVVDKTTSSSQIGTIRESSPGGEPSLNSTADYAVDETTKGTINPSVDEHENTDALLNNKENIHKKKHHNRHSSKYDDKQLIHNVEEGGDITTPNKFDKEATLSKNINENEQVDNNYQIVEESYDEKILDESTDVISQDKDLNSLPKLSKLPELPDFKSLPKLPSKEELAPLPDIKDLPPLPDLENLPNKNLLPPVTENGKEDTSHEIDGDFNHEKEHNESIKVIPQEIDNDIEADEDAGDVNGRKVKDSVTDQKQSILDVSKAETTPALPLIKPEVPKLPDLPPLPDLQDLKPIPVNPDLGKFDLKDLPKLDQLPELPDLNSLPKLPNKEQLAPLPDLKDLPPLPDLDDLPNKNLLPPVIDTSVNPEDVSQVKSIEKEKARKEISLTGPPLEINMPDITNNGETLPQQTNNEVPANMILKPVGKIKSEIKTLVSENKDITSDVHHKSDINEEKPKVGNDPAVDPVLKLPDSTKSKDEIIENNPQMKWRSSKWTECSRPCGDGVKTRTVTCVDERDQEVANNLCDINTKPTAIEDCFIQTCLEWRLSQWSECSATCGYSIRQRNVVCPREGACSLRQKPVSEEQCTRPDCVKWMSGQWSRCSKKCEGGEQVRLVQCVNLTSQLSSRKCDYSEKPSEKQTCNTQPCKDKNAALTIKCEHNEMSWAVCRALRRMGQCHRRFVSLKCCKTCSKEKLQKLNKERPRSRALR